MHTYSATSPFNRVTIFSLPKRRTFFDNDYYQPYKLFCKAGKIFLDICWTLTAFDNYTCSLIISINTAVCFLIYYANEQKNINRTAFLCFELSTCMSRLSLPLFATETKVP